MFDPVPTYRRRSALPAVRADLRLVGGGPGLSDVSYPSGTSFSQLYQFFTIAACVGNSQCGRRKSSSIAPKSTLALSLRDSVKRQKNERVQWGAPLHAPTQELSSGATSAPKESQWGSRRRPRREKRALLKANLVLNTSPGRPIQRDKGDPPPSSSHQRSPMPPSPPWYLPLRPISA